MTSKEQAEALATEVLNEWLDCDESTVYTSVLKVIPLTELLEVAMAAEIYWRNSSPLPGAFTRSQGLDNALEALRATGKVKI